MPISSADTPVSSSANARPSHGERPCAVVSQAVAYAAMPTNAAWPNDVAPPTPVSSTRPSATSAPMPMSFSSETVKVPVTAGASASATTTMAIHTHRRRFAVKPVDPPRAPFATVERALMRRSPLLPLRRAP